MEHVTNTSWDWARKDLPPRAALSTSIATPFSPDWKTFWLPSRSIQLNPSPNRAPEPSRAVRSKVKRTTQVPGGYEPKGFEQGITLLGLWFVAALVRSRCGP